jgi:hypothetical protein
MIFFGKASKQPLSYPTRGFHQLNEFDPSALLSVQIEKNVRMKKTLPPHLLEKANIPATNISYSPRNSQVLGDVLGDSD